MTLRDAILASEDIKGELVEVPEWDATIEMRTITAAQRARLFDAATGEDGHVVTDKLYSLIIVMTSFDPDTGERVFDESDAAAIADKSAKVVSRVADVAMRLSGLTDSAVDEEGKAS